MTKDCSNIEAILQNYFISTELDSFLFTDGNLGMVAASVAASVFSAELNLYIQHIASEASVFSVETSTILEFDAIGYNEVTIGSDS